MKNITYLFLITLISFSCSSESPNDDGNGGILGDGGLSPNGESKTTLLTGGSSQKWWRLNIYEYYECGNTDTETIDNSPFFAFSQNGNLYTKNTINESSVNTGNWSWSDNESKIVTTTSDGVEQFSVLVLNSSNFDFIDYIESSQCNGDYLKAKFVFSHFD